MSINTRCLTGMIFAFRGVKVSVLGYPTPLQDCNFLRGSFTESVISLGLCFYISLRNFMLHFVQNGNGIHFFFGFGHAHKLFDQYPPSFAFPFCFM